jgi:hypothetical protein
MTATRCIACALVSLLAAGCCTWGGRGDVEPLPARDSSARTPAAAGHRLASAVLLRSPLRYGSPAATLAVRTNGDDPIAASVAADVARRLGRERHLTVDQRAPEFVLELTLAANPRALTAALSRAAADTPEWTHQQQLRF